MLAGGRIARTVTVGPHLGGNAERLRAQVRLGPSGAEPCAERGVGEDERAALLRREGERRLAERTWRAGELAARLGWDGAWASLLDRALESSAGRRSESAAERAALAAAVSDALGGEPLRGLAGLATAREPRVVIEALRAGHQSGSRAVPEQARGGEREVGPTGAALMGGVARTPGEQRSCRLGEERPCRLGSGRAAEVGWNAALPLLAALAAAYGEVGLARDVAALVASWPAPRPYGRTLALASTLGVRPRRAVEAQGLLHVQELWCERGGCGGRCPFSPASVPSDSSVTGTEAIG